MSNTVRSGKIDLIKLRLVEGVWHGVMKHDGRDDWQPDIEVTHLGSPIADVVCDYDRTARNWRLQVPVPPECISDGVQVFVIKNRSDGTTLGNFTIIAGDPLAEDIRAEMSLLRAELDLLKQAFRRHCVETAVDE